MMSTGIPLPPRVRIRGTTSWAWQSALDRRGLGPVAGVDEAGRGACAGPLVVAACILRRGDGARLSELTDSKSLSSSTREHVYDRLLQRALDYSIVALPESEIDLHGVHAANGEGIRRAVARLVQHPGYVLIDGFAVPGLPVPSLPVVQGDQAVACVAAASVLAKVTRDRIMTDLDDDHPEYGFATHKGYNTSRHGTALRQHGPSVVHRWSYANVALAAVEHDMRPPRRVLLSAAAVQYGVRNIWFPEATGNQSSAI